MARFTFSAGNARVLARTPLYALGALAAAVVPRSPRRWVYGSGIGLGEGAFALHSYATATDDRRHTWLASTAAEHADARSMGMHAVRSRGPRGLWETLRAGVVVVTHGFGDVNRFGTRGAVVVQLWHGIPLKRLHLDTGAALRLPVVGSLPGAQRLMSSLYRSAGRQISLFPVASERVGARIRSAFGIPADRVVALGDPRDDVLLAGTPDQRRSDARARIEAALGEPLEPGRLVLYAPTWRDGAPDPAIPSGEEWSAIAEWCDATATTLLIRSHPLGAGSYARGAELTTRIQLLGSDRMRDVTPALPGVDAVLTDFSSVAFDAAIAGVPSVFFAPDVARYLSTRGLYMPYEEFTGGQRSATWHDALQAVDAALEMDSVAASAAREHARWLRDEHVDHLDGHATRRVYEAIRAELGEAEPPTIPAVDTVLRVTHLDLDAETFSLEATVTGGDAAAVAALTLVGARQSIPLAVTRRGDTLSASGSLLAPRWGSDPVAPVSGDYRLHITLDGTTRPTSRVTVAAALDPGVRSEWLTAAVRAEGGGLVLTVSAPLSETERGPAAQRRLEKNYRARRTQPQAAVFFESFYAQNAACNPLALDRELARARPDVARYWSVVDRSVAVPDGAIAIVEGSAEWWRVRAEARLLVVNDWLRKRWMRRPHQTVLQTWHGTPLKRLALDREGVGARTRLAVRRESARWDVLLAQSSYAAEVLQRAYGFRGEVWVEGYPRNDTLVTGDRSAVRRRLGLRDDQRVVLYAPTWRDDATELVDYADLARLPRDLVAAGAPDAVVLVRGHSRTLRHGSDRSAAGLLDVTSYPDMSDLLLAADVVVTDYSSIMFDALGTDAPILLFVPDLERYRSSLRGFYFDLTEEFPGPVLHSRSELVSALAAHLVSVAQGAHPEPVDARRTAWQRRFSPLDDGRASERVVARILESGMLD